MSASLKLLESLAFLIGGALALAFAADWFVGQFGYQPGLFCWALMPIVSIAYAIGFFLTVMGLIVWGFSFFRNEKPALIALGGVMLTFLPQVLPHYLGVSCIL